MVPISPSESQELMHWLSALLPAQFEEVLYRLNVPIQYLPHKQAPQAERVIEFLRWVGQDPEQKEALLALLTK